MMDRRSEVLVVGAGPSGLVVAALLARAGRRVTVIDQHREAGPGALVLTAPGLDVLRELGWLDALLAVGGAVTSRRLVLAGARGRIELDDEVEIVVVPRPAAVEVLVEQTLRMGAVLVEDHAAAVPVLDGHRVVGVRARNPGGEELTFGGETVVDATGATAFLATSFGQIMPRKGPRRVRLQARLCPAASGAGSKEAEAPGVADIGDQGDGVVGLDAPILGLARRGWLQLLPGWPAFLRAVLRECDIDDVDAILGEIDIPPAVRRVHGPVDRWIVPTMPRTAAGHGWVAVGRAAGSGCPGLPGAGSAGLAVAASAAWEIDLALSQGRVVAPSQLGATLNLSRQSLYLESLLDRALGRAAAAGLLGEATATPRRRRILSSMLLGRWVARHGRLARVIYLWWLDHRSRRAVRRAPEHG